MCCVENVPNYTRTPKIPKILFLHHSLAGISWNKALCRQRIHLSLRNGVMMRMFQGHLVDPHCVSHWLTRAFHSKKKTVYRSSIATYDWEKTETVGHLGKNDVGRTLHEKGSNPSFCTQTAVVLLLFYLSLCLSRIKKRSQTAKHIAHNFLLFLALH